MQTHQMQGLCQTARQGIAKLSSIINTLSNFIFVITDPDAPFFCNFTGGALSPLTNTPGSLLDILGQVTGLEKPTVNSLRRGMESHIQKNEYSRKRINILQGHSESVGLSHYDKGSCHILSHLLSMKSQRH